MGNKFYRKGYRKENMLVTKSKEQGYLSFRSAGSHSPIDVVIIDHVNREIRLVQCKPSDYGQIPTDRLYEANKHLNGAYDVKFIVA